MTRATRRLTAIATGQLGVFSRQQAHAAEVTDDELRGRVQSGLLEQAGPHVFRVAGAPTTPHSKLKELMLDVGDPCWASGPSAAALHGFDGFRLARPFHVAILRGRDVHRRAAVVHTTTALPLIDRASASGVAVTSAARTVIDLARMAPRHRLTIAVDSGLRDGKFSEDLLHRRIVALRSSGRHGMSTLLEAIEGQEVIRGGHSWLERHFLQMIAGAGLPRPSTQQVLTRARDRLVRVDCRFPGTPVVVELLGYRFHRSADQLNRDAARLNALITEGYWPYQFTYDHVVSDEAWVVTTLRGALSASASAMSGTRTDVC